MTATPQSVLVYVGLDRVGDSLLKLPFVRGLRAAYPDAHITWLAGKDTSVFASVMAPMIKGLIDEVIECADIGLHPKELLRRPLGGRRFDMIIDTQRVALATFILWRIRHQTFVSPFGNFILSSRKPPRGYKFPKSMQRQILDLLEIATGKTMPSPEQLEYKIDPAIHALAATALPDGATYVGFAPGSGGLPKCWPLQKFVETAKAQISAGRVPVMLLGPQEQDWMTEIKAAVPEALFPLQTDNLGDKHGFTPGLTIALGQRLAVAVSNDSGVGHMLAISGAPLVSLFGRTVPEKFMPMSQALTLIRAQDYGGREMDFIPVDAVQSAVDAALGL